MKKPPLEFDLTGDSKEGYDGIDNLKYRIERYGRAKKRTMDNCTWLEEYGNSIDEVSTLCKLGRVKYKPVAKIEALELKKELCDCGNWMLFRHYYNVGVVRLANLKTCKKPLMCQLCAIRRASKSLQAYLKRFEVIVADKPDLRPYFLTLTVTNGKDLKERFEHLKSSFDKYNIRRRKFLSSGKFPCELNKIHGAVYSYEFTNKDNDWHPHLHILCLCNPNDLPDFPLFGGTGKQKSNSKLSLEWGKITKDSFIVDFRPIDGIKGFIEVFKYALKFTDMSPELNYEAYRILKGKRLTGAFGLFRGVTVPEEMTDDLIKDQPYMELFYKYLGPEVRYSLEGYKKVDGISLVHLNGLKEKHSFPKDRIKPKAITVKNKINIKSVVKIENPDQVLRVSEFTQGEKWYTCSNCGCVFEDVFRDLTHVDCEDCGSRVSTIPIPIMIPTEEE